MFPSLPVRATFVADTKFVSETQKNVSDFFQKHFVSATNVSRFAQHGNNHEKQCVRNIVSSFATHHLNKKSNGRTLADFSTLQYITRNPRNSEM